MQVNNNYFQNLMLNVKNMRVKHVRKMFVLLREIGTDLQLSEMKDRQNWTQFHELNKRLQVLVVEHGLTLGEFATGYVLNIQTRQRDTDEISKQEEQPPTKDESPKRSSSTKRKLEPKPSNDRSKSESTKSKSESTKRTKTSHKK